jgi:hypothetical protein
MTTDQDAEMLEDMKKVERLLRIKTHEFTDDQARLLTQLALSLTQREQSGCFSEYHGGESCQVVPVRLSSCSEVCIWS